MVNINHITSHNALLFIYIYTAFNYPKLFFLIHQPSENTTQKSASPSPDESDSSFVQSPGTLFSVVRRSLLWPVYVSRAVCATPRRVCNWLGGKVHALGQHLRENADDYTGLYELLSVGLPLLVALYEILLQMHAETGPLDLQPLQQWVEQHLGRGFLT